MKIFQSFQWESWQKKEKDKTMEFQLMGIDDPSAATESQMYPLTTVERCISFVIFLLNTCMFRHGSCLLSVEKNKRRTTCVPSKQKENAKLSFSVLKAAHDK